MSAVPESERRLIGQIAANAKWAKCEDRAEATAAARKAAMDRFEKEVDPEGVLTTQERAIRAEYARKAYFTRLNLKSVQARRRNKEAAAKAIAVDTETAAIKETGEAS